MNGKASRISSPLLRCRMRGFWKGRVWACIIGVGILAVSVLCPFRGSTVFFSLRDLAGRLRGRPRIDGTIVYVCGGVATGVGGWPDLYAVQGSAKPRPLLKEDPSERGEHGDPALSPKGDMIAYVAMFQDCFRLVASDPRVSGPSRETYELIPGRANRRILVARIDGSGRKDLSAGLADDIEPAWSPDGKHIAFSSGGRKLIDPHMPWFHSSYCPGDHQIWVMDADGKNRRQITNHPTQCFHPTWSPDGKQIAFVAVTQAPVPEWVRTWVQSNMPPMQRKRNFLCDLWVMNADGTGARQLTGIDGPPKDEKWWKRTNPWDAPFAWEPHWSPFVDQIVFVYEDQLYLASATTGHLKRLTAFSPRRGLDHPLSPCWSPDGQQICFAFERYAGRKLFSAAYRAETDIYVIRRDGSRLRRLTYTNAAGDPSWGGQMTGAP